MINSALLFTGLPLLIAGCGMSAYFLGRSTHPVSSRMLLAAGFTPYVIIGGFLKIFPVPTYFGMLFCWLGSLMFAAGLIDLLLHQTAASRKAATVAALGFCMGVGHAMLFTYPFLVDGSFFNIR